MRIWQLVVVLSLAAVAAYPYFEYFKKPTVGGAIEILGSKTVLELTTERVVTQSIISLENNDILLGDDTTLAYATVTLHYGVDVDEAEIIDDPDEMGGFRVKLPPLRLLASEIDEETIYVDRDASGLQRLLGSGNSQVESEVRQLLKEKADEFARVNGAVPSQNELEERVKQLIIDWSGGIEGTELIDFTG